MPARFCGAGKLLVALAFLACVSGVSATNTAIVHTAPWYGLHGPDQAHDQTKLTTRPSGGHSRPVVDENDEERGIGIGDIPGAAQLIYKMTSDKQKAANRLFQHFNLGNKASNMFTNAKFLEWKKTVAMSFKTNPEAANAAMYLTMKSQLGDESLAKMLATEREVSATASTAKELQAVQFAHWISSDVRADGAFKLFKLDRGEDNIFARPEFRSWISFLIRRKDESPVDGLLTTAMMYGLHAHYSDEALAKMTFAAKEVPRSSNAATKVQNALFSEWTSKTEVDVFKLLKLDKAGDDIFQSPTFSTWVLYLRELERTDDDLAVKIIAVLRERFGEGDLAKMLYTAKQDAPFADKLVISNLQKAQFTRWREQGKNPARFLPDADPTTVAIVKSYRDFYHS
ncbi:hypothetical protein PHYSODRAFT_285101 [Phytophthora sojae]|uniref:RxLR effector protein n=2 Tax=Phytophthora sojae TaxID=67593 RepID=G4YX73_PHYSP|nr:hypothetical protein PHYSODRAFT_285101 [Phytophthora sojae]AEK80772.1 Avh155 [Phytophthora sojae]AEK80773.1 Avh155 [Phytophthora sojae]AEK80774.1 Avh155 [Phytophthora sojae]EGZ25641.1 hypothetical protein PHYSODRAFT_285101 [Phytophthora sojae]|eukprot:XP_009520929.1 hypothetical protein PHYSODRAFT_285101 [Phytophthora sojae]